ncbi:hypothetical protein [Aliiroseovarius crassostreae]|uniref:hypothetical protein n=1 Tax=Aliiroseovarius crassostreae TaxID=154981 RepID=UPI000A7A6779|nr:hypothetical protein [Aliiroseovarius crassostreae]
MSQAEADGAAEVKIADAGNHKPTAATRALKFPRKTFYDKLTRHGIRAEDYRG